MVQTKEAPYKIERSVKICPKCGSPWDALAEMLKETNPPDDNFFTAMVIVENCPECKEHFYSMFAEERIGRLYANCPKGGGK